MMDALTPLGCGHFATGRDAAGNPVCELCAAELRAAEFREQMARADVVKAARPPNPTDAAARPAGAATAAATTTGATEFAAGVHNMDDPTYFADPLRQFGTESLSSTGARHITPPCTPAHYRWWRDHPADDTSKPMQFGKAVHRLVLGAGAQLVDAGHDWRDPHDRAVRDQALAAGQLPLHTDELDMAGQIARAVLAHPVAGPCFAGGAAEQAMFARDPQTGVWLRGRADYLKPLPSGGLLIADLKTTRKLAAPAEFRREAAEYRYHRQADWYTMLAELLGLAKAVSVLFVVVETRPPHQVACHQIRAGALTRARHVNRVAIRTFAHCLAVGAWPGYPHVINQIDLPAWVDAEEDDILTSQDLITGDTPC